jgi:arsenate reductase
MLLSDRVVAFSAGTLAQGLNPMAVKAMAQQGVDISGHSSNALGELDMDRFDCVVTVCNNARDNCPTFPGRARVIHHAFDDPPALAENARSDEEALSHYLRVCGEIREWVAGLPERIARER